MDLCSTSPPTPVLNCSWSVWDEKTSGDSETRNWMAANTKPCPKCNKPVEKNGGCNHVTCKCGQVWTHSLMAGTDSDLTQV